ncbi:MAG: cysteine desulfurase [Acidobacteria bacterium]|nr:cysteine desulfurase [Acidobacteriota bacterium]
MSAYLDHAATGPMRPEAVEAMLPFLTERYANPSGAHRAARDARRAIDEARDELADLLGVAPGDIIFTSGGTEADNLAVFGAARNADREVLGEGVVVCSAVEHHAVLDPVAHLGGPVIGVDQQGRLDLDHLTEVLREQHGRAASGDGPGVRLVSVMAVNNEIGTIQPLDRIAKLVRRHAPDALLHTDAVQAFCWTDIARTARDANLLSVSAHKFGGPKGVGALASRAGATVHAMQLGGGQERGRRPGTQNVAGIVAMTVAARITAAERESEILRIGALRDRLLDGLVATVSDLVETTAVGGVVDRSQQVAGIAHVCIAGVESEALLFLLEREGVFASAASSCSSGAMEPSHVLAAIGIDPGLAAGSLRLSLGHTTTEAEIDHALAVIPGAVAQLRRFDLRGS